MTDSLLHAEPIKLFNTVYGIGPKSHIPVLIKEGARTIEDLRSPKYSRLLPVSSNTYIKYYDDLQLKIPRSEIQQHEANIKRILPKHKYKVDIVGSYRRGAETSGDLDVLVTTKKEYSPETNYIRQITETFVASGLLLETLKIGQSTMNGIIKLGDNPARRIDVFFSPPELYPFALLAKTADANFNKSIRTCIKEKKNSDYILSEKGIRVKGSYSHAVDPQNFPDVGSIFDFIGLPHRKPHEMVGYFPCVDDDSNNSSSRKTKRSRDKSSLSSLSRSPSVSKNDNTRKRKRRSGSFGSRDHKKTPHSSAASKSSAVSSLTHPSSIGSEITETDPGENYENWAKLDQYDSDETYLSPIGSKYTSRNNNNK